MQINESEAELILPAQPFKGKANIVLPKLLPSPSAYRIPEDTSSLTLLQHAKGFEKHTADIPSKGVRLPPIKSAEELTQAEQKRLKDTVRKVKDRKAQEWPDPGETLETWKARQCSFRIDLDETLNDEWNAFTFLLQQKQAPAPKIAISRLPKS